MAKCHDLEKGKVYQCQNCGLEIEIKKSCDCKEKNCKCLREDDHCSFKCCGQKLKKK